MFHGFARVWTPVELSARLRRAPVPLTVAGERVVLFRDKGGRAAALLDRCPHRGVALSLGRITADGALECPFHGWRFNGDGACVHAPLNPRARLELLSATALPVHEEAGLLWLYTAAGERPAEGPVIAPALRDPGCVRRAVVRTWRTHWTRAMENMLDMPHLPFVHATTIGSGLRRQLKPGSEMEVTFEPTAHGGRIRALLDGKPDAGSLDFVRPNAMVLHLGGAAGSATRVWDLHVFCVPAGPGETRMIFVTARNFLRRVPPVGAAIDWFNGRVALQDQPVIESSDPAEVPPPGQERSVASDRATLQFRKYYDEVLRAPSGSAEAARVQR